MRFWRQTVYVLLFLCVFGLFSPEIVFARDAAFIEPGGASGSSDEAVRVEPKADVDVGETVLNVAKRTSVFFVNISNSPVKIEKVSVNSDSDVTAEASANDCTKQGTIEVGSRCSVEVSVTAVSPGTWSVDVLMTHNGAGRITRARLTGKTSGATTSDTKGSGLAVNAKDVKPIEFGDVVVGDGKTVRSTLMVNDSPEPISIYAIDVIEADNGLTRLDQGCAVDMELAPGASCPVTLLWIPKNNGPISTDLIIRHSGRLGFAVIPIRGSAKGSSAVAESHTPDKKEMLPLPPSALALEKEMAGHVAAVSSASLGASSGPVAADNNRATGDGHFHLIGTIGERALFLEPDGSTTIVPMGGDFEYDGKKAKLVEVKAHTVAFAVNGTRKTLSLEAVSSLVDQAAKQNAQETASSGSKNSPAGPQQIVALPSGSVKK